MKNKETNRSLIAASHKKNCWTRWRKARLHLLVTYWYCLTWLYVLLHLFKTIHTFLMQSNERMTEESAIFLIPCNSWKVQYVNININYSKPSWHFWNKRGAHWTHFLQVSPLSIFIDSILTFCSSIDILSFHTTWNKKVVDLLWSLSIHGCTCGWCLSWSSLLFIIINWRWFHIGS